MRILCDLETVAIQGEPPAEEHLCDLSSVHVLETRPFGSAAAQSVQARPLTTARSRSDVIGNCLAVRQIWLSPNWFEHNTGYEGAQEF